MFKYFLLCSFGFCSYLAAAPMQLDELYLEKNSVQDLIVNNRVLLKINGKVITVMDVVRKMDLLFYRQYPELASSSLARYQFYTSGWRTVLDAVIDDYLIMADAKEKKITINDGEVREELEKMFGPDVVVNLDKVGMTLEEAFELLKTELTVQRMTSLMVRSKALTEVHPISVKKQYEKMLSENPPLNYWVYRILSIRGKEHEKMSHKAHQLIQEEGLSFEQVVQTIQKEGVDIAYSEEFRQKEKDLSLSYKAVLQLLAAGSSSAPVSNQNVSRIFSFKGIEKVNPPAFREVEDAIKQELTQEAIVLCNQEYRNKLRKLYGLSENYLRDIIPRNLQPFALR